MYTLLVISIFYLFLLILGSYPLFILRYKIDLSLFIENISKECDVYNENISLQISTYKYHLCSYLYDSKFEKPREKLLYHFFISCNVSNFLFVFFIVLIYMFYFISYIDKNNVSGSVLLILICYFIIIMILFSIATDKIDKLYSDSNIIEYYDNMFYLKIYLNDNSIPREGLLLDSHGLRNIDLKNLYLNKDSIKKNCKYCKDLTEENCKNILEKIIHSNFDTANNLITDLMNIHIVYMILIILFIIYIFKILDNIIDISLLQMFFLIIFFVFIFFYTIFRQL